MTSVMDRVRASAQERWPWIALALAGGHLVITAMVMGLRPEHFAANLLLVLPAWWGGKGTRFSRLCLPLWMAGLLYEYSKYIMFLQGDDPLIRGIYEWEKAVFGINTEHGRMILSEYFAIHNWPVVDFIAGLFYSVYLWHVIFVSMIFVFVCPERQPRMAWGFFTSNVLGLIVFLLFPVAPPWYVAEYGFQYVPGVLPDPAGAIRFDQLLGIGYFQEFYKHNATVFGAMPSLHVGYPLTVALATLGMKHRGWQIYCFAMPAGVAFSAFYLQHHYIWDLIGGVAIALVSYGLVVLMLHRKQWDGTFKGFWRLWVEVPEGYEPPA